VLQYQQSVVAVSAKIAILQQQICQAAAQIVYIASFTLHTKDEALLRNATLKVSSKLTVRLLKGN